MFLIDCLFALRFWFQEVRRIRSEHPDDACAVINDRVKGSLKVTRAFGAGFLKQACSYPANCIQFLHNHMVMR